MNLELCKDQFLMFLCMLFYMHEKELVGQKSLFFLQTVHQALERIHPARVDPVSASRVLDWG